MGKSDSKASQVEERKNAKALKGEGAQHVQITDKGPGLDLAGLRPGYGV